MGTLLGYHHRGLLNTLNPKPRTLAGFSRVAVLGALLAGAVACTSGGETAGKSSDGTESKVMTEAPLVNLINLDEESDFQQAVLESPVTVIVDLWAPWCGPCKVQGPILEKLARKHSDRLKVVKVNVDDHPELATRFQVQAIPTLLVFEDGRQSKRLIGVHSAEDLAKAMAL